MTHVAYIRRATSSSHFASRTFMSVSFNNLCVCVCVCVCARARVRACVTERKRVLVHMCERREGPL